MEHMKIVHIFILMSGNFIPYAAAEIGTPVVGSAAVFLSLFKIEEFTVLSLRILTGLYEPFMLIGAMVYNQIHQNVHITFFCFLQKPVDILDGAEAGIDVIIIGNIIALVRQRRTEAGGQPDDVHSQVFQVIQLADDTGNITDSVTVGIVKALGINLIRYLLMPPFSFHVYKPPECSSLIAESRLQSFVFVISVYLHSVLISCSNLIENYVIMTSELFNRV